MSKSTSKQSARARKPAPTVNPDDAPIKFRPALVPVPVNTAARHTLARKRTSAIVPALGITIMRLRALVAHARPCTCSDLDTPDHAAENGAIVIYEEFGLLVVRSPADEGMCHVHAFVHGTGADSTEPRDLGYLDHGRFTDYIECDEAPACVASIGDEMKHEVA